jgi:hypothetical protein
MDQDLIDYLEFHFFFVFCNLSRYHDKKVFYKWIDDLESFLSLNSNASFLFLDFFSNQRLSKDMLAVSLITSGSQECRVAFVRCAVSAIKSLRCFKSSDYEIPSKSNRFRTRDPIVNFMYACFRLCAHISSHWRTFSEYFQLFKDFASLGDSEKQLLLDLNVISEFHAVFMGHESPVLSMHFDQSFKYGELGSKTERADCRNIFDLFWLLICSSHPQATESKPPTLVILSFFPHPNPKY